ncbi:PQQ-like beta-propeller repeat protein [Burkholderiaceae bacterium DAT-1]|nr:PQQ-like beta-propeller repeat protein [Burkholderiaceae bacterium DAT-1]
MSWNKLALPVGLLLSGCGGSGGSSSPVTESGSNLTGIPETYMSVSEGDVKIVSFEGDVPDFVITAPVIPGANKYSLKLLDSGGVVNPDRSGAYVLNDNEVYGGVSLKQNLKLGNYSGFFEIRVCNDDADICAQPVKGSPFKFKYAVEVKQNKGKLSPVKTLSGASSWDTEQGNPQHTGYVGASVDPTKFSRRFRYDILENIPSKPAVKNGIVMFGASAYQLSNSPARMYGVDEATGNAVWITSIGSAANLSGVSVSDDLAFIISDSGYQKTSFNSIDIRTGSVKDTYYSWEYGPGFRDRPAATPFNGSFYFISNNSGVTVYNPKVKKLGDWQWHEEIGYWDNTHQAPAIDASGVYALSGRWTGQLKKFDASSGLMRAAVNFEQDSPYETGSPVLSEDGSVYAISSAPEYPHYFNLVRIDVQGGKIAWRANGSAMSQPVLAKEYVYTIEGDSIVCRYAKTGQINWTWASSAHIEYGLPWGRQKPLIVVGNYAFFVTNEGTKALDLTTKKIVWHDVLKGELAVSQNGILYIAGPNAVLAVNLR